MLRLKGFLVILLLVASVQAKTRTDADIDNGRCGGPIEADYGRLTFPSADNFSGPSTSGELCIWTIHLKTTSTFRLNFSNLDVVDDSQNCDNAAVRLYSLTNLIPAGRAESYSFCNSKPPPGGSFSLSENLITVIYRTNQNSTNAGSGFTLNWEGISIQPIEKSHESTFTTASSCIIRYPVEGEYPPNQVSTWLVNSQQEVFQGPNAPTVQLQLPYVQTEPCGRGEPNDCLCDALILYQITIDGQLEESSRLCGNVTTEDIQDISPNFILAFFSDYEDVPEQGSGFELVYRPTPQPPTSNTSKTCGGILSGASGLIEYKLNETYNNDERCVWTIRTEGRTQISLTLNDMGLEYWYDVLEVLAMDMRGNTSSYIFRVQDKGIPVIFDATVAIISFYTDGLSLGTGFSLSYEAAGGIDNNLLFYRDTSVIQNSTDPGGVLRYPGNGEQSRNGELSTFFIQHAYSRNSSYEPMTLNITALNLERDLETGDCKDVIRAYRLHSVPGTMIKLQEVRPYIPVYTGLCQMDQVSDDEPYMVTDYIAIIFLLTDNKGRSEGFEVEWNVEFYR